MSSDAVDGDELLLGVPDVDEWLDGVWVLDLGQGHLAQARAVAERLGDEPRHVLAKAVTRHLQGDMTALELYDAAWSSTEEPGLRQLIAAMAQRAALESTQVGPDGFELDTPVARADPIWEHRYRSALERGPKNTAAWLVREMLCNRFRWRAQARRGVTDLPEVLKEVIELQSPLATMLAATTLAELYAWSGDYSRGAALLASSTPEMSALELQRALLLSMGPSRGHFVLLGYDTWENHPIAPASKPRDIEQLSEAKPRLRAVADDDAMPQRARALGRLGLTHVSFASGDWAGAREEASRAEQAFAGVGDLLGQAKAHLCQLLAGARDHVVHADIVAGGAWLADFCRRNGLQGWPRALGSVFVGAAQEATAGGELEAALGLADAARELARAFGDPLALGDAHAVRVWGLASVNAVAEARVEIEAAHGEWAKLPQDRIAWHRRVLLLWSEFYLAAINGVPDARRFRERVRAVRSTAPRPSAARVKWATEVHQTVVDDLARQEPPREWAHLAHEEATQILLDDVVLAQQVDRLQHESTLVLLRAQLQRAMAQGDVASARTAARRALEALSGMVDEQFWIADIHELLGETKLAVAALERYELAGFPLRPAVALPGVAVQHEPSVDKRRRLVAQLHSRLDNFAAARRLYRASGVDDEGSSLEWEENPEGAAADAVELARIAVHEAEASRALRLLERAADVVEACRAAMRREANRRAFASASWVGNVYAAWASGSCRLGFVERGFEIAELARARSLLELSLGTAEDEDSRKLAAVGSRLEELTLRLANTGAERDGLIAQRHALLREYNGLEAALAEKSPRLLNALLPRAALVDVEGVRRRLSADELLIAYHFADHEQLIWAIGANGIIEGGNVDRIQGHRFSGARARALIEDWLKELRNDGARERELGCRVSELVLPFADAVTRFRSVIFCPWGPLASIPFHALPLGGPDAKVRLGDGRGISTLPAATLLRLYEDRDAGDFEGAVVAGDPSSMRHPVHGLLDPLPAARLEAAIVASRLGVTPLLCRGATRRAVLESIGRLRCLHLATHGWYAEDNPLSASVAVAHGQVLTAADLQASPLDVRLAVLSACDVGRGRAQGGELLGLARSILAAGARAVLLGLWRAAETATLFLMDALYRRWDGTVPIAVALAGARDEIRKLTLDGALARLAEMRAELSERETDPLIEASYAWVESDLHALEWDCNAACSALERAIDVLQTCGATRELALARARLDMLHAHRTVPSLHDDTRIFDAPSQWAPLSLVGDRNA